MRLTPGTMAVGLQVSSAVSSFEIRKVLSSNGGDVEMTILHFNGNGNSAV